MFYEDPYQKAQEEFLEQYVEELMQLEERIKNAQSVEILCIKNPEKYEIGQQVMAAAEGMEPAFRGKERTAALRILGDHSRRDVEVNIGGRPFVFEGETLNALKKVAALADDIQLFADRGLGMLFFRVTDTMKLLDMKITD